MVLVPNVMFVLVFVSNYHLDLSLQITVSQTIVWRNLFWTNLFKAYHWDHSGLELQQQTARLGGFRQQLLRIHCCIGVSTLIFIIFIVEFKSKFKFSLFVEVWTLLNVFTINPNKSGRKHVRSVVQQCPFLEMSEITERHIHKNTRNMCINITNVIEKHH